MKQISYSEETLRRYLVGDLSAPEQAALETEYFADPELYDRICEAESDLIQDYLGGKLSQAERERFESHYLATPEKRQQIEFSRAMTRSIAQTGPTESAATRTSAGVSSGLADWWSSLLASLGRPKLALGFSLALAALLALSGGWLLMNTLRLRRELAEAQTGGLAQREREEELKRQIAVERAQSEQLTAELERAREQLRIAGENQTGGLSTSAVITILLSGGLLREGSKQNTFRVPPGAKIVQIRLKLKSNDYLNYQATLNSAEGKYVWSRKQVKARGATISLRIPAKLLPTGDYLLTLSGVSSAGEIEDVSSSYFRVDKR